jgi:hypothetical protein
MPATSIRDLTIKDADLVAGTHGRGFWILDDVSPLRQITPAIARLPAYLFNPPTAWRFRWNKNTDTPLPPDEPAAPNPPDGVVISYLLGAPAAGPVVLEIVDPLTGDTVRRHTSDDVPDAPIEGRNIPDYWLRPAQRLRADAGLHRFVWDLRYAPPAVERFRYPIAAIAGHTPRLPLGVLVNPGTYQVRLLVDGHVAQRSVLVKIDPRVKVAPADLTLQFTLSRSIDQVLRRLAAARAALAKRREGAAPDQASELQKTADSLQAVFAPLPGLLELLQEADARPLPAVVAAVKTAVEAATRFLESQGGSGPAAFD